MFIYTIYFQKKTITAWLLPLDTSLYKINKGIGKYQTFFQGMLWKWAIKCLLFLESKVVPTFAVVFTAAYLGAAVYCYNDYWFYPIENFHKFLMLCRSFSINVIINNCKCSKKKLNWRLNKNTNRIYQTSSLVLGGVISYYFLNKRRCFEIWFIWRENTNVIYQNPFVKF